MTALDRVIGCWRTPGPLTGAMTAMCSCRRETITAGWPQLPPMSFLTWDRFRHTKINPQIKTKKKLRYARTMCGYFLLETHSLLRAMWVIFMIPVWIPSRYNYSLHFQTRYSVKLYSSLLLILFFCIHVPKKRGFDIKEICIEPSVP